MRRTWIPVAGIIGTLGTSYAAAVGFVAVRETALVFPGARPRELDRSVPNRDWRLPWDTLRMRAADGAPVFLLESRAPLPPDEARPWVLFFHGNAGHVGSRGCLERYRLLHEAGFNVLAVEFRGFGASSANGFRPDERGLEADALAGWRYLTDSLHVPPGRIATYGWSLGGGPAAYLAEAGAPAAVITEGAFTSLPDIGAEMYPWIPTRLVMRNRFDNARRARTTSVPWLVLHGRLDNQVPFAHGAALASAARQGKLVRLEAGHEDGVVADREVALAALREVATRLRGARGETRATPPSAPR